MPRKPLSHDDADRLTATGVLLYDQLIRHNDEILKAAAGPDAGRMADAIARAQADLATAYVQVTTIVRRQR